MKVILYAATSLNGMIAAKNDSEDFLADTNRKSLKELAEKAGCFIIGRKTYEITQNLSNYNFDDINVELKMVISSDKNLKLNPPFFLVNSPKEAIKKAISMNFKRLVVVGWSLNNSAFIRENLVDEIILNIEPVIVGSWIPVFAESEFEKRLSLIEVSKIADDILQVRYRVDKK